MSTIIAIPTILILLSLTFVILYQWLLAIVAIFPHKHTSLEGKSKHKMRFLVLIPAHNEELCLGATLRSLQATLYPKHLVQIIVIADRCKDRTAAIASEMKVECLERDVGQPGKGSAIAWGLNEVSQRGITFDALVVLDADTVVAPELFEAFEIKHAMGQDIQQAYCYISNPWQSVFTRIIAVTSVMRNGLFYAGKNDLGLTAMLTGTGMFFSGQVVDRFGWTAFTVGEDWEFSVALILTGEKIYFNSAARVFQLESNGLKQAARQRLRWAGGRYGVVKASVWNLVKKGIRARSVVLLDAALTLCAPNYSSQASLGILCLGLAWMNIGNPVWGFTFTWATSVIAALAGYFLLGVMSTESPLKALGGLLLVPVFLPWRLTIELLGMLGYGRRHWGRMSRATVSSQRSND